MDGEWETNVCTKMGSFVSLDKVEPSKLPLWVKLRNLPLEPWSLKGISAVASRFGTPLIMDQITTNMCKLGNGRLGFARVLVDVEARKGLPEKIEIVFGHCDKNYRCRPRSIDEFMEMERNKLKKKQESAEFIPVQHRKRGGKKVNINEGNKKENEGIKSKNVMYKPVEKDDSKAMSQNKARKRNKFNVLRDYDGNAMQENDRQNKLTDDEEDDVIECSGIESSMNANEVVGLDSNIVRGMYTSDKQNEVAKFITDEKFAVRGVKLLLAGIGIWKYYSILIFQSSISPGLSTGSFAAATISEDTATMFSQTNRSDLA
ncbi:RNA-directed DNA polymerase, eukaryota, reverse transcriptase zinc-binding domain protein [Tanacetum coccineum]